MNDTRTTFEEGASNFGGPPEIVDLDTGLPAHRPVAHVLTPEEIRAQQIDEETELLMQERAQELHERQVELQRLTIEMLITKAWHERLQQMRGDNPEIGTRDVHLKNVLVKTLMTIGADNANLSIEECERL